MTAIIRPVTREDIPAICQLLHEQMNTRFSLDRWRQLFEPGWASTTEDWGLVVEDKGTLVGFHGNVCSHRVIAEQREPFVNFSSWFLQQEYRGKGLGSSLVRQAIQDPNKTYTVFSLSPKRIELFKSLGLNVLEEERVLWSKRGGHDLDIITDVDVIQYRIWPEEQRLLLENLPYGVKACLASALCAQCLVLYRESVKADGRTYFDVLYRNDARLFSELAQQLANALLPDENAYLATDRRFILGPGLGAKIVPIVSPRFYASSRVAREDVDLLYSELQLLDLKLD